MARRGRTATAPLWVETANGNKYAAANGKTYSNTGSGWDQTSGSPSSYNKSSSSGWGGQEKSGGSSAMEAEAAAGIPGLTVLVVRQAWDAAVAGVAVAVAGESNANFAAANEFSVCVDELRLV